MSSPTVTPGSTAACGASCGTGSARSAPEGGRGVGHAQHGASPHTRTHRWRALVSQSTERACVVRCIGPAARWPRRCTSKPCTCICTVICHREDWLDAHLHAHLCCICCCTHARWSSALVAGHCYDCAGAWPRCQGLTSPAAGQLGHFAVVRRRPAGCGRAALPAHAHGPYASAANSIERCNHAVQAGKARMQTGYYWPCMLAMAAGCTHPRGCWHRHRQQAHAGSTERAACARDTGGGVRVRAEQSMRPRVCNGVQQLL